jgi:hypothetical protein
MSWFSIMNFIKILYEIMNNINKRNKFSKYNDLDIYKKYDFILIINLQEEINNIFSIMNNVLTEKKQILSNP